MAGTFSQRLHTRTASYAKRSPLNQQQQHGRSSFGDLSSLATSSLSSRHARSYLRTVAVLVFALIGLSIWRSSSGSPSSTESPVSDTLSGRSKEEGRDASTGRAKLYDSEHAGEALLLKQRGEGADARMERRLWEETAEPVDMDIVTPAYSVRVLRSIINHSNNTWQDTPGEAHGWVVQSLLWLNVVYGMRPDEPEQFLRAECNFDATGLLTDKQERAIHRVMEGLKVRANGGPKHATGAGKAAANEAEAEQKTSSAEATSTGAPPILRSKGVIHAWPTHPGDRFAGHSFPFHVDCEIPSILHPHVKSITNLTIDLRFQGGLLTLQTVPGEEMNVTVLAVKKDLPVEITPPMPTSEFAVCLSPLLFDTDAASLTKLVEWRHHLSNIGINRVNWYFRDEVFRPLVETFNTLKGTQDIFRLAPILKAIPGDGPPSNWEHYSDQDAWYLECMLNNVQSSSFVLVLDTDEYVMPDFSSPSPLTQFPAFMRWISAHVGTVEMDRVEMVRSSELGPPPELELSQTAFGCASDGSAFRDTKKWGAQVKTFYRSHSVAAFNQHRNRKMYPMPPEQAVLNDKRKNERYWWHLQRSNDRDVWPKLMHYRYYKWKPADTCDSPSPMEGMPKYDEYLAELRSNVTVFIKAIKPLMKQASAWA